MVEQNNNVEQQVPDKDVDKMFEDRKELLSKVIENMDIGLLLNVISMFAKDNKENKLLLDAIPHITNIEAEFLENIGDKIKEYGYNLIVDESFFSLTPHGISIMLLESVEGEENDKTFIEISILSIGNKVSINSKSNKETVDRIDEIIETFKEEIGKARDKVNKVFLEIAKENDDLDVKTEEIDSLTEDENIIENKSK